MNWFGGLWVFEKWKLYHHFLVFSSHEFPLAMDNHYTRSIIDSLEFRDIYFIKPLAEAVDKKGVTHPTSAAMEQWMLDKGVEPEFVHNIHGKKAFAFYYYNGPLK